MSIFSINSFSEWQVINADTLQVNNCSCTGTNRYTIPRHHIDYIHVGTSFSFGWLFVSLIMVIVGFTVPFTPETCTYNGGGNTCSTDKTGNIIFIALGFLVMLGVVMSLFRRSFVIQTNTGKFISTACCAGADAEAITAWLGISIG
jgi:hypothetical protein